MAVRKLILDDSLEENNFTLIGIHCVVEDYRLAYLLNKVLDIGLQRCLKDISRKNKNTSYPIYEWEDELQYKVWNLVTNNCKIEYKSPSKDLNSLFNNTPLNTKSYYLIPEFKKANFLLKIEDHLIGRDLEKSLKKILDLPQVITAYCIDKDQLKSKANLIFN